MILETFQRLEFEVVYKLYISAPDPVSKLKFSICVHLLSINKMF